MIDSDGSLNLLCHNFRSTEADDEKKYE